MSGSHGETPTSQWIITVKQIHVNHKKDHEESTIEKCCLATGDRWKLKQHQRKSEVKENHQSNPDGRSNKRRKHQHQPPKMNNFRSGSSQSLTESKFINRDWVKNLACRQTVVSHLNDQKQKSCRIRALS